MALFESRKAEPAEPATKRASRRAVDSVDEMRRRARHRLIGACVLVLLAIMVFPLVFDTEPRQMPVTAEVRVLGAQADAGAGAAPSQVVVAQPQAGQGLDEGEELVDMPVAQGAGNEGAQPAPAVAPSPAPSVSVAQRAAQQAQQAQRDAGDTQPRPQPEKPATQPERPAEPAVRSAAVVPPPPVSATSSAAAREAERARALLEGRAVASAAPAAPAASGRAEEGRFIVQVGAFSDESKVREIRTRLEAMGLRTYTQVVQTGSTRATRVRVGPFNSRTEADRAAKRVQDANLPAAILSL